jgi:serine/threonine protein kinase
MLGTDVRKLDGVLLADKYRIEKRLGVGGMGEVYRATNEAIGRKVAVKVLHPEMLRNVDIVERFMREAKAATIVRHPNVVDVLDVLTHEGVPFIVQELLVGEDLAHYVDGHGGKLSLSELCALLLPVVDAVGLAHSKGVVHRDLKPENVFLHTIEGQLIPKVLDFGISKITRGDSKKVTATGTAMGTPAYMSPEQIQSVGGVDARSDVWALGVILYELAAGVRPFDGETPGAMFVQACTVDPKPLSAVNASIPAEYAEICAKCIRRNRDERYNDARELARALRTFCGHQRFEPVSELQEIAERFARRITGASTDPIAHEHRDEGTGKGSDSMPRETAPALASDAGAAESALKATVVERSHPAADPARSETLFSSESTGLREASSSGSRKRWWIPAGVLVSVVLAGVVAAARRETPVLPIVTPLQGDDGGRATAQGSEDSGHHTTPLSVRTLQLDTVDADGGAGTASNGSLAESTTPDASSASVGNTARGTHRVRDRNQTTVRQQNPNTSTQTTATQTGNTSDTNPTRTHVTHGTTTYE